MTISPPRVFNIAAGLSFVDALAAGLIRRHGAKPEQLAAVTVLLPTRRGVRALRDAFLRQAQGRGLLLPTLRPLGDLDSDDIDVGFVEGLNIPPGLPLLERHLLLMQLVRERPEFQEPAQAAALARALGALLDETIIEGRPLSGLKDLAPADYAVHWQQTVTFLQIVTEAWPAILQSRGVIDMAERRDAILRAIADRWRRVPPSAPIYAAGSTGSLPATADLLAVVARLPSGGVVLPGLDCDLDQKSWDAVENEPTHPQYSLHRLLQKIDIDRSEVADWEPSAPAGDAAIVARRALISLALRPTATTDDWMTLPKPDPAALKGLSVLHAPGPEEEANAIALLLREALEQPGRTAALVTSDRTLARRVAIDLSRYGIVIDDSAGIALSHTAPGSFLRLTAEMLAENLTPLSLLAALKHPLACSGEEPSAFRRRVQRLEMLILRGPRPAPGLDGLLQSLQGLDPDVAPDKEEMIDWLGRVFAPVADLMDARETPLRLDDLFRRHIVFAEHLARRPDGDGLWSGEAGEAAARFVSDLDAAASHGGLIPLRAWPALLAELMSDVVVRPRYGLHPRLFIWGPLEARLQQVDRIVLGGLNEGVWPSDAPDDPWLSRPLRQAFGLPSPERQIGLAAHDFQQAANAPEVILCRTEKKEGAKMSPSRWLLRLEVLLKGHGLAFPPALPVLQWQSRRDHPAIFSALAAPAPRPPLALRPRKFSVTEVEQWVRDPYAIFAKRILRLKPLRAIDEEPGPRERGTIIHTALETFGRKFPDHLPDDALAELTRIGERLLNEKIRQPEMRAYWQPRFYRIAEWFVNWEAARRAQGWHIQGCEMEGCITFDAPGGSFHLKARADRIDRAKKDVVDIIDYKTGSVPSKKQMESDLSPQLPLEAAMILNGGFADLPAVSVDRLIFLKLTGGAEPGEEITYDLQSEAVAIAALDGLKAYVAAFDRLETPYRSRLRVQYLRYAGDYDHLARSKEWRVAEREE